MFDSVAQLTFYLKHHQTEKIIELFQKILERYQLQQARLQALMDTVNEAVCIIDKADKVIAWNRCAENLYNIRANEIMNKPIETFFSNLMINSVMKEQRRVEEQYHTPCADKHVLINAQPIHRFGNVIGAVCCERDITELVQLHKKLSQPHQQVQSLKKETNSLYAKDDSFSKIYGHSRCISEAIAITRRVAPTKVSVLLRGESGTGKELFARAIHDASQLKGPFVAINCGAIQLTLFESELFGYEPGAFTGADRKGKKGFLEHANGGTVLLDEIGDMPKDMQVKLLRALQEKTFYRVGGSRPVHIDVRIIAATNCNLEEMIDKGDFREDLYYRLNVVTVILPPLRERLDDIPELVHRGLEYYCSVYDKKISKVDPHLMATLVQYQWPGNIRELYNVLERLVILSDSDVLAIDNLPKNMFQKGFLNGNLPKNKDVALLQATEKMERDVIQQVLREASYNKAAAAKRLGIPRSTLYYKMKRLGLEQQCQ